ncbi:MAG: alpha-L-fucosidase, partial [Planctomycetota bacterium]
FGMFVHWGLYSAAGGMWDGEVYPQHYAEWIQNWAAVHPTEYGRVLKPLFTAEHFDADEWAALAERAGMRYAVITTKHHEGFTLFNSAHPYSVDNPITGGTNISPEGRDLIAEWTEAYRERGLKVGLYYSLLDWQHPHAYPLAMPGYTPGPLYPAQRDHEIYREYILEHTREMMENYGKIDILWWDYSSGDVQGAAWGAADILSLARKKNPDVLTNNRFWSSGLENRNGDFATPEKYVPPTGIPGLDWEVNHTMNESYGFSLHDDNWKTREETIRLLVDIVSKGGNLLFNVGPRADGTIPPEAVELLEGVGQWMDLYGDAIYGTQASPFAELPFDGRVTMKRVDENTTRLYLHLFAWPESGRVSLTGLSNEVTAASLLHDGSAAAFEQDGGELVIALPAEAPHDVASVIAVDIVGEPDVEVVQFPTQKADRTLTLNASDGIVRGETLGLENGENLGFWTEAGDDVLFPFVVTRPGEIEHRGGDVVQHPGRYRVVLEIACANGSGGQAEITLGHGQKLTVDIAPTGGWGSYEEVDAGEVTLSAPGHDFLHLKPVRIDGAALMNLRSIRLVPVE